MTILAFVLSVFVGVGSLAFAYNDAGYQMLARYLLVFGGLWLFAIWQRWRWFSSIGIFILVALAGFGLWNELSPGMDDRWRTGWTICLGSDRVHAPSALRGADR